MQVVFDLAEHGWFPDPLVRRGIRSLLAARLRDERRKRCRDEARFTADLLSQMRHGPIAVATEAANEQHYEVPAEFFGLMLGPHRKYSSCYWPSKQTTLAQAEEAMLNLTCERAALADGHRILELGCGWGSLTLWMAAHYPNSKITAVSNSHTQRAYIEEQCARKGYVNVDVITCDLNDFEPGVEFDRVVSVEMFEHMRNYGQLMCNISGWLKPDGKLFVHLFCHRSYAYFYEPSGPSDWMAREFFSGGTMPSDELLLQFQEHLEIEQKWRIGGQHYQRTLETWLEQLDSERSAALEVMGRVYGSVNAETRLQRWRLFLIACAELFGYQSGNEWWVAHYLFGRPELDGPRSVPKLGRTKTREI